MRSEMCSTVLERYHFSSQGGNIKVEVRFLYFHKEGKSVENGRSGGEEKEEQQRQRRRRRRGRLHIGRPSKGEVNMYGEVNNSRAACPMLVLFLLCSPSLLASSSRSTDRITSHSHEQHTAPCNDSTVMNIKAVIWHAH